MLAKLGVCFRVADARRVSACRRRRWARLDRILATLLDVLQIFLVNLGTYHFHSINSGVFRNLTYILITIY